MKPSLSSILALGALASLAACVHGPQGYMAPDPAVRVVVATPEEVRKAQLPGWTLTLPFGAKQDGTELMLKFMEQADAAGAKYLSDVSIVIATEEDGQPVECRTRVVPVLSTHTTQQQVQRPGHIVSRPILMPVTRTVTEMDFRCQMVSEPRTVSETYQQSQYDPSSKTTRSVTRTRMVTRHEMRQRCSHVPVTRTVTRYEYQHRSEYIPPRFDVVTQYHSLWNLTETPPECTPRQQEAQGPSSASHRIEGRAHGCTNAALYPTSTRPIEDMTRAERLREQIRQKRIANGTAKVGCEDQVLSPMAAPAP
ncbi:hypothetical protein [Hyalangium gracile]|uniref:hypothetical protein n=1 Tax=Hyalangium gracile TaxID=394092 RepID=UPI001CCC095A|nr:hypothetical protein [Hyalangium gracile]